MWIFDRMTAKKHYAIRKEKYKEFYNLIRDIAEHPTVLSMRRYPHHGRTSCYQHCLHVAYYNYLWCRMLKMDARSAARAGMLHDLFLYDWHTHARETGERFHGLTHPAAALQNAERIFELNDTERDIIRSHMWPVTPLAVPQTGEAWITTLADKYCGGFETVRRKKVQAERE